MKKRIFIGSSSESINVAKTIKDYFSSNYDCILWEDDFFTLNQSTYENILKKSIAFDYAIFVGGKDDFVKRLSQKTKKYGVRDNVYLEFGLFAGIISPSKTFFVVHKACTIATDLDGITVCKFNDLNDIIKSCVSISKKMDEENKLFRAKLLPSVSLAIGYYENFLKDACYAVSRLNIAKIDDAIIDISTYKKQFKVVVPENVTFDWKSLSNKYYQTGNYIDLNLTADRTLTVKLDYDKFQNEKTFSIVDFPQTLRSSFKTIDFLASKDFIGENELINFAKQKEVYDFIETTKVLANSDAVVSDLLIFEKYN